MIPQTLFVPLGRDSRWHNNELRYALRSWSAYSDVTRLIIAGDKPEWLDCEAIQWPYLHPKTLDIFLKAQAACSLTDQFVFGNDDHFLLQPLKTLPNYYYSTLTNHKGGSDRFKDYVLFTQQLFPDGLFYDIHTPMIMDNRLLELRHDKPVVLKSLFGNSFPGQSVEMIDPVIRDHMRTDDIELFTAGKPMFAVNDNGLGNDMKRWLQKRFPEKSRWEK